MCFCLFLFFKQKTAYEMRISDWSSDVCSSDLQDLTLADALSRVARGDPSIAVGAAQQQAAEASIRQADVRPRDVIGVDVEDFAGTGPYSPIDRSQTTAWYERTWERGGKREAREMGRAHA